MGTEVGVSVGSNVAVGMGVSVKTAVDTTVGAAVPQEDIKTIDNNKTNRMVFSIR